MALSLRAFHPTSTLPNSMSAREEIDIWRSSLHRVSPFSMNSCLSVHRIVNGIIILPKLCTLFFRVETSEKPSFFNLFCILIYFAKHFDYWPLIYATIPPVMHPLLYRQTWGSVAECNTGLSQPFASIASPFPEVLSRPSVDESESVCLVKIISW